MMSANRSRLRRQRGQSLVIVALAATLLLGIVALGLDGGHLYMERRDVQNAADGGALAGAVDLIPAAPSGPRDVLTARYDAVKFAFNQFSETADWGTSHPAPGSCAECAVDGTPVQYRSVTVTPSTPVNGEDNRLRLDVQRVLPTTFAAVLGFTTANVAASAQAIGGFRWQTYAVFATSGVGSGNTVNVIQNGWAQIDDGQNGNDPCDAILRADGHSFSNGKWHSPNPNRPGININGFFAKIQAADDHSSRTYWQNPQDTAPVGRPQPNYQAPRVSGLPPGSSTNYSAGSLITIGSQSFVASRDTTVYAPGWYDDLTLSDSAHNYIFQNGVYNIRNTLTITGGRVGNTIDARHYADPGVNLLPPARDGTDGGEFVFEPSAAFSATGGETSLVSPNFIPAPTTNRVLMYFKDTGIRSGPRSTVFSETIANDGVATAAGYFHLWGTIFDANFNGSHGTLMTLTAVSFSEYAVTGQFIAPTQVLDPGGFSSSAPGTGWTNGAPGTPPGSACPPSGSFDDGHPALLVQFKKAYAPTPLRLAFLVK
jgi:Flp pilus assembly protein TadG